MKRKSLRLLAAGYYKADGKPCISYKETLYKVFQRRRYFKLTRRYIENDVSFGAVFWGTDNTTSTGTQTTHASPNEPETRRTRKGTSIRTICSLAVKMVHGFLLLSLAFGTIQMRGLQMEVHSLKHQIDTFFPYSKAIPNFALESQGARVLPHMSSDTFLPQGNTANLWNKVIHWGLSEKQQKVIQGNSILIPGECWPFSGDRGHLFISLSQPVSITHVTLGHITKCQSTTGQILSAPKEFSIYGMKKQQDRGMNLGTLVYDQDGAAFQTFRLSDPEKGVYSYVKLQIESNWGNADYTCLYSFRVHSKVSANCAADLVDEQTLPGISVFSSVDKFMNKMCTLLTWPQKPRT